MLEQNVTRGNSAMLQESSKPEKPARRKPRNYTPALKRRILAYYGENGFTATNKKWPGLSSATIYTWKTGKQYWKKKETPGRKVPLYMHTLAKQVRRAAINFLHSGQGGDELAETALMLARKVMEGEGNS